MSWEIWDREHRSERLSGPAGRRALDRSGVGLHLDTNNRNEPRVLVSHRNIVVGKIDQKNSDRYRAHFMKPNGLTTDLEDFNTHDKAVRAILAHNGISVPKVTSADEMAARIHEPQKHSSVVVGPYTGKRAAPTRDMSAAGRFADSTATRIRMNNPRSATSAEQIAARNQQPTTVSKVKQIYGDLITLHKSGKAGSRRGTVDNHLQDMASLPEAHHRFLARHMQNIRTPDTGIHLGDVPVTQMKGTAPYWSKILTDAGAAVPGSEPVGGWRAVHYFNTAHTVVGSDRGGSLAAASHELGHGMDRALGTHLNGSPTNASDLPHFRQVYNEVTHMHDDSPTLLNPYYTDASSSHGPSEMFAEAYNAHNYYRGAPNRDEMIGRAIGAGPDQRVRVGRALGRYFDIHDQTINRAVRK